MDNFISSKMGVGNMVRRMRRWTIKLKNGYAVNIFPLTIQVCQFLSRKEKKRKKPVANWPHDSVKCSLVLNPEN